MFLIGVLLLMTMQSCKKYPEGNGISLRSRTERVANTWKVENYKVNGEDYTSLVSGYTESYTKNGAFSYQLGLANGSGNWRFQNNDKEIKLDGSDDQSSRTLFIGKLEEKAFWYYYMEGNDRHDLHLISN